MPNTARQRLLGPVDPKLEDDDTTDMITAMEALLGDKFDEQNKAMVAQREEITMEIKAVTTENRHNQEHFAEVFEQRIVKLEHDWWGQRTKVSSIPTPVKVCPMLMSIKRLRDKSRSSHGRKTQQNKQCRNQQRIE